MLFCETYQSTNLDSLKLLSFYFTIFDSRDNFFLKVSSEKIIFYYLKEEDFKTV